jgi:hypothetical protein
LTEDIVRLQQIAKDTCIVRNTAGRKGRTLAAGPGATALRYLHYGRIVLDPVDAPVRFDTNELETGLVCLNGSASVRANGEPFTLGRFDSLYVPRGASIEVAAGSDGCDLAEIAAPVEQRYPVQFVPFTAVKEDPALHCMAPGVPRLGPPHQIVAERFHFGGELGFVLRLGIVQRSGVYSRRLGIECTSNHETLAHFLDRADAKEVVPDTV